MTEGFLDHHRPDNFYSKQLPKQSLTTNTSVQRTPTIVVEAVVIMMMMKNILKEFSCQLQNKF